MNEASSPSNPWHASTTAECARRLTTNLEQGLSDDEAKRRLQRDGPNALPVPRTQSIWKMIAHQFASVIVMLLMVATVAAFVVGEHVDAIAILCVIVLNAVLGFTVEFKAERTLQALREQDVRRAVVVRANAQHSIDAAALVVGDIILLDAGVRVPADARVIAAATLQVEEAALTGEAAAVEKSVEVVDAPAGLADRTNMVHASTTVTAGRGRAVVTAVGAATELGRIGALLDAVAVRATPLEEQLSKLARGLVVAVVALSVVIVGVGVLRGHALLPMVELGISLAIAAVPEGLAAVTTMTLALGMQRMAKMGALVRRLAAVETLGATTVICTDKTGTLTKNEMTVRVFALNDGRTVDVTGSGYGVDGALSVDAHDDSVRRVLQIGALCNDAHVERGATTRVIGDPTEGALVVAAEKAGAEVFRSLALPRVAERPFTSGSQRMITVHREGDHLLVCVKGSPAVVLASCALTEPEREAQLARNGVLAATALRVLALAWRTLPADANLDDAAVDDAASAGLNFAGFVGMQDPLRDEARTAIETCRTAGIRTIMITGDQPATAAEIARQLGIDTAADGTLRPVVRGKDLVGLDAAAWAGVVADTAVFARVSPEQKLQIVQALQQGGAVVAMTGDGVNDAPALKTADIGVAMGKKGTAVAKDTADMIITDDNFATLVVAVEQGRVIYANIQKFILYLFSCNVGEIAIVFVAVMVGLPVPLLALQILWLNLITDVLPAFALALEPSAPGTMREPPRPTTASIVDRPMVVRILWQGALLAAVTLLAFGLGLSWYGDDGVGLASAMTMAFMTLSFVQLLHAFTARSRTRSLFAGLFDNRWLWGAVLGCAVLQAATVLVPPLRAVLHVTAPSLRDWLVIAGCSTAPLLISEVVKAIGRRRRR
jgi:Ca2+-transporting ATPase